VVTARPRSTTSSDKLLLLPNVSLLRVGWRFDHCACASVHAHEGDRGRYQNRPGRLRMLWLSRPVRWMLPGTYGMCFVAECGVLQQFANRRARFTIPQTVCVKVYHNALPDDASDFVRKELDMLQMLLDSCVVHAHVAQVPPHCGETPLKRWRR
jgi:hypothetical protein